MSTTIDTTVAPIGWFEIAASDIDRAEAFYGAVFNWSFTDGPTGPVYRIVHAGDGISGGVTSAQAGLPATYAIFSAIVPDVAAACDAVVANGGRVLVGPETVPGTGLSFANVVDPDGNHFGVFCPPAT